MTNDGTNNRMNRITRTHEKITGYTGTLSGAASVLGSWQVCHTVCLGIIALLGMIGITVAGMPLAFLTKFAFPFWTLAIMLLVALALLSLKKQCVSRTLLLFNFGLIVAGTPLPEKTSALYGPWFWVMGGIIAAIAAVMFVKGKMIKGGIKKDEGGIKMKNTAYVGMIVLIILLGGYSLISLVSSPLVSGNRGGSNVDFIGGQKIERTASASGEITIGTTDDGDVAISLTPQAPENGVLNVVIAANTHSVDLSQFNLMNNIILEYKDKRKQKETQTKPVSAPQLSGHHANGVITFALGQNELESFAIAVLGIPKEQQRVYQWTG